MCCCNSVHLNRIITWMGRCNSVHLNRIITWMGRFMGTLTWSWTGNLMESLNGNFDGKFNGIGSLTGRSTNTLMGKGEYGEGRWSPGNGKSQRNGGNRNSKKKYKKGIIIFLFTHATPGTPASNQIKLAISPFTSKHSDTMYIYYISLFLCKHARLCVHTFLWENCQ